MMETGKDRRSKPCAEPNAVAEPSAPQPVFAGPLLPLESFLPSLHDECQATASTKGFDNERNAVFQQLMNDSLTAGFLAAAGIGLSGKAAKNTWTPGIIYNRRVEAWVLLDQAVSKLRALLGRLEDSFVKSRLTFSLKPGLDGIDARSYSASYLGWKSDVMDELAALKNHPTIKKAEKKALKEVRELVTEIDEQARTYWKHRLTEE